MKPHSPSCDRNQQPILETLNTIFPETADVLEIGSGTGQHAVYFSTHKSDWRWQTSDVIGHHEGIQEWLADAGLSNALPPLELEVCSGVWPDKKYDAVFSANTAHIMSWDEACCMIRGVARVLMNVGCFCLYGPFNKNGEFNSESNRRFDAQLRTDTPHMGIRDIEDLVDQADSAGLSLDKEIQMPANNRILVFKKN
jgi:hypothetical protein